MRIAIFTQNDQLYLNRYIEGLIRRLQVENEIVVVGLLIHLHSIKNEAQEKVISTIKIFGIRFFIYYSLKYLRRKLFSYNIQTICEKQNISFKIVTTSINSKVNIEKIEQLDVDLIISLSCNQIFKQRLLETPKKGCINLHCSALPRYRGLMPSFWTIFHEETVSAATVFYIDSGIDTGPIIVQDMVDIRGLNQEEVINVTKQVGISSICEAVNRISEGMS